MTTARIIASYGKAFSPCLSGCWQNPADPLTGVEVTFTLLTRENFKIDCSNEGVCDGDIAWKSISAIELSMHTVCARQFQRAWLLNGIIFLYLLAPS